MQGPTGGSLLVQSNSARSRPKGLQEEEIVDDLSSWELRQSHQIKPTSVTMHPPLQVRGVAGTGVSQESLKRPQDRVSFNDVPVSESYMRTILVPHYSFLLPLHAI